MKRINRNTFYAWRLPQLFGMLQGFSSDHMRPWKAHWDRQLYKALEHQYQMGLEALNENLPEIKVELTYR